MRHTFTHRRSRNTSRAIAVLIALSGLAGACDRHGDARDAIDTANIQLATLDSGLGSSTTAATRDKVYSAVVSSLSDASSSERAAYASSANILLAKAHAGLAETPAATAGLIEADSLNRARVIRADLSQWLEMSTIALAAEKYDPAPEVAALETQIKEIDDAVAGLTNARTQIAGRHSTLTADAAALTEQSAVIRSAIGELRIRSTTVSATEAATISEQIREQSRAADALDQKASEILAVASPLVPQISEIELNVAGLNNQINSLRAAQAAAVQRGKDAATEASEAHAVADAAAARLDTAVNDLTALREGDLARAYEQALRSLSTASATARKAATDNRSGSKLAEGVALQQTGDLVWQQAHGLTEFQALLTSLAAAQPPLPRSGAYDASAAAASEARGEALTRAAEAYEQAKSALTSSGARGEAAERLDRVGRMLDLIIQATQGQAVDWSAANRPAPSEDDSAAATDGDASEATGDEAEVRATIQGWIDSAKAKDFSFIGSAVHSDVPAINSGLQSVGSVIDAFMRLDAACTSKFGQSLLAASMEQAAAAGASVGAMEQLSDLESFSADSLRVTVDGDVAMVTPPDAAPDAQQIKLARVDGVWKFEILRESLPPEFAQFEAIADQVVAAIPRITAAIDEVTATTESGGYVSIQAVTIDLNQKIQPIAMEIMGSMQPPPGGG